MAERNINATIIQRNDTSANWKSKNPVLKLGEIGIETDTKMSKCGDGKTAWNSLLYSNAYNATTLNGKTSDAYSLVHTHPYRSNTWLPPNDHSHANMTVLNGITSAKITEWDSKSTFSGSYNDLTNKPTIPTVDVNKTYVDEQDTALDDKIKILADNGFNGVIKGDVSKITDLDTFLEQGAWSGTTDLSSIANLPLTGTGAIRIRVENYWNTKTEGAITQKVLFIEGVHVQREFYRNRGGSLTWSPWKEIATTEGNKANNFTTLTHANKYKMHGNSVGMPNTGAWLVEVDKFDDNFSSAIGFDWNTMSAFFNIKKTSWQGWKQLATTDKIDILWSGSSASAITLSESCREYDNLVFITNISGDPSWYFHLVPLKQASSSSVTIDGKSGKFTVMISSDGRTLTPTTSGSYAIGTNVLVSVRGIKLGGRV